MSILKSVIDKSLLLEANYRLLNYTQIAGFRKRSTTNVSHTPDFTQYDKLPGDQYQTVYVGYYDDKRHTDPRAIDRFYRLNWGGWIRARGGRGTKLWRKDAKEKFWSKQHVLCNKTQSEMLEKMFSQKYRKKKYFVDDFYEQYENRDFEFLPVGHAPYSYSYINAKEDLRDQD